MSAPSIAYNEIKQKKYNLAIGAEMEDIECSISKCSASLHDEPLFTTARHRV